MTDRSVRPPSIRDPRSIWDVLSVVGAYILLELIALWISGSVLVRTELVVLAAAVFLWMAWAILRILDRAREEHRREYGRP